MLDFILNPVQHQLNHFTGIFGESLVIVDAQFVAAAPLLQVLPEYALDFART